MTNVVCDNTMSAALTETGPRLKVRHSCNSIGRLAEVRDAVGIVHSVADGFAAQVAELCRLEVSEADWRRFLTAHAPIPNRMSAPRAKTLAAAKQVALDRLWNHDARVTSWRGTAWGVIQAVNTYTHHEQTVRGADRAERNMLRAVEGGADTFDRRTLTTLKAVLS